MRIWDIPPSQLCRTHLLGEHRELHAIWTIITTNRQGYRNHPETKRWEGKLAALYHRHEAEVQEMIKRHYIHQSDLDINLATGDEIQNKMINSIEEQIAILRSKNCHCEI